MGLEDRFEKVVEGAKNMAHTVAHTAEEKMQQGGMSRRGGKKRGGMSRRGGKKRGGMSRRGGKKRGGMSRRGGKKRGGMTRRGGAFLHALKKKLM